MSGYIGYIASRPVGDTRAPQHIQNMVIREYCRSKGLAFKLSATEYATPHCYMMLEKLVADLPAHDGIVAYSMFMLPRRAERRRALYDVIISNGCSMLAAVEDIRLETSDDVDRWEDILKVAYALDGRSTLLEV